MPKMIVGRRVEYIEVFEIDTDKIASIRDDLDLCQRLLWSVDPTLSQQLKSSTKEGKAAIRFLCRIFERISKNPIYPVKDYSESLDECVRYIEGLK